MGVSAAVFAVSTATQLYANNQNQAAANATRRAQKKARDIDQRVASINNQREKRKAIAATRARQASLENQAAAEGLSNSSATLGGSSSLQSSLAGSIGFQNTQLAGAAAKGAVLQEGADKAADFSNNAAYAQVASSTANAAYNKFWKPQ